MAFTDPVDYLKAKLTGIDLDIEIKRGQLDKCKTEYGKLEAEISACVKDAETYQEAIDKLGGKLSDASPKA